MECNRDEAIRAKAIAEKKLTDKDFTGAKKFTLKAQTLYPNLDGISHLLNTLDVYMSYEKKVNGESDWYGILDVNPSDDDETIKKQYRKLILMLHPDKNKSVGADGAFKILSEAWTLLSDKVKRSAYNQRRNSRVFQPTGPRVNVAHTSANRETSKPNGVPVWATPTNPSHAQAHAQDQAKATKARARAQAQGLAHAKLAKAQERAHAKLAKAQERAHAKLAKAQARAQPSAAASVVHKSNTFWTICPGCKTHHEYIKMYLNYTLLCHECHKPFLATETPVPSVGPGPSPGPGPGPGLHSNKNIGSSRGKVHGKVGSSVDTTFVRKFREKLKRDQELCAEWTSKRRKVEDGGKASNVSVP